MESAKVHIIVVWFNEKFANKMKIFYIRSLLLTMVYVCVHDNNIKTENVQLVYQLAFLLLFRIVSLIFCCTLKRFFYSFWSDYESFSIVASIMLFCCCEHTKYTGKSSSMEKFFIEKLLYFFNWIFEKNSTVNVCC